MASEKELVKKVLSVASDGDCRTDSAEYRMRYDEHRRGSLYFHVIKLRGSFDITASVPCLEGHDDEPLIIVADKENNVTYSAGMPLCIGGGGGAVIMDGLNISSGGVVIESDGNVIVNSRIYGATVKVKGNDNRLIASSFYKSSGNGLEISGDANRIIYSSIEANGGFGIVIRGRENRVIESRISRNSSGGISVPDGGALISHTEFSGNGNKPISKGTASIPAPERMISIDGGDRWIITGYLGASGEPLDLSSLKIELFLKEGPFIGETEKIDRTTGQFVFYIQKPLKIEGVEITSPVFVATAVDNMGLDTSEFSMPLDPAAKADWDGDGLSNEQEDLNGNGVVDPGETDPRKEDTDGDGLTDGEERLHTGRIKLLIEKGLKFADISKLDPTNPDSDGDCLPDGVETGISAPSNVMDPVSAMKALAGTGSQEQSSYINGLSSYCRGILKDHNVTSVTPYDTDPMTTTDPTSADTDNDGLKDGEEDWNFNGRRDIDGLYLETDPDDPDSDKDTLLDGHEGDINHNGRIDDTETDPLFEDTDGDGIPDGLEIGRYGTLPNSCDSDRDGLPDGIEAGVIHPNRDKPECSGLQTAGTNFSAISRLSPTNVDSDADGIPDGDEDANRNGWLDPNETDPTADDTDADGADDYTERTLDIDRDGLPDIDIAVLKNGDKCSPPKDVRDLDCDGIFNVRDLDSDNDGCSDKEEWERDRNGDGVPDAWQYDVKSCDRPSASSGGGGGSGGPSGATAAGNTSAPQQAVPPSLYGADSPDCSLDQKKKAGCPVGTLLICLPILIITVSRSNLKIT